MGMRMRLRYRNVGFWGLDDIIWIFYVFIFVIFLGFVDNFWDLTFNLLETDLLQI